MSVKECYSMEDAFAGRPLCIKVGEEVCEIPLLPLAKGRQWLQEHGWPASEIESFSLSQKEKVAMLDRIVEAVSAYAPDLLTKEFLENRVSPTAILELFYVLIELTDPFESAQRIASRTMRQRNGTLMDTSPENLEKVLELASQLSNSRGDTA